jgi:hypothetical protein
MFTAKIRTDDAPINPDNILSITSNLLLVTQGPLVSLANFLITATASDGLISAG